MDSAECRYDDERSDDGRNRDHHAGGSGEGELWHHGYTYQELIEACPKAGFPKRFSSVTDDRGRPAHLFFVYENKPRSSPGRGGLHFDYGNGCCPCDNARIVWKSQRYIAYSCPGHKQPAVAAAGRPALEVTEEGEQDEEEQGMAGEQAMEVEYCAEADEEHGEDDHEQVPPPVVKQEIEPLGRTGPGGQSGRVRHQRQVAEARDEAATRPADLTFASVELHAGSGRLSRELHLVDDRTKWSSTMVDIKDSVERCPGFEAGATARLELCDIDTLSDGAMTALVTGIRHIHVAPSCERWSNQTEGEEQHRAYRAPGREGEASTSAGRDAERHLEKVIRILLTAVRHNPEVIITFENPHAGMSYHRLMKIVEKPRRKGGLGLTKTTLDYCMHDEDGPKKPTDLWTDCKGLIEAYKDGKFRCSHTQAHRKRVSGSGCMSRHEAAAYPPKVAKFWATCISREAKQRYFEQRWRDMAPEERAAQQFGESDEEGGNNEA